MEDRLSQSPSSKESGGIGQESIRYRDIGSSDISRSESSCSYYRAWLAWVVQCKWPEYGFGDLRKNPLQHFPRMLGLSSAQVTLLVVMVGYSFVEPVRS